MNSYIDIAIVIADKKYIARLYGDKIVCEECGLNVDRSEITSFRVQFFKRKLSLIAGGQKILADFNSVLFRWFDPLFEIRYFVTGIFMILPILAGFLLFREKVFCPSLIIACINGFLINIFFRIVRENRDEYYPGIIMLVLAVSLPMIYWYPFSAYIFAGAITLFLIFGLIGFVISRTFLLKKYHLSLAWIVITIYYLLWILSAYKFSLDFQNQNQVKDVFKKSSDGSTFTYQNVNWEKPLDWQISEFKILESIIKRRSMLWQFSPLPVEYKIATSVYPDFGWITVLPYEPEKIMGYINGYLASQGKVFLLEVIEAAKLRWIPVRNSKALTESFLYYDMIERKEIEIHVFIVPVIKTNAQSSIVFAFALPQSASVNYYLDLITEGFEKN